MAGLGTWILGGAVKATELWDQKHYIGECWVSSVC